MSITLEVHGLKELSAALQEFPKKLQGQVLGAAVKAGAELIRDQAKLNARMLFKDPTGATEKSIVAWRARFSRPDDITYQVGVTMKKQWPRRRKRAASGVMGRTGKSTAMTGSWSNSGAFWWRFTEFNTTKRAATPWLRPAWDMQSGYALRMIKAMLKRAIPIAVAALPKYRGPGA